MKIIQRIRSFFLLLSVAALLCLGGSAEARQGFAVGVGPMGNIYLIDTIPVMDPGIGGYAFFNYRFAEQFAFETAFMVTAQSGTNVSKGDNGILFLGMPTVDFKYYFRKNAPKFDPFATIGVGLYWLTEGSVNNSSGGLGLGAQLGMGFDYYLTDVISLGFQGMFRSIGLITNFGTPSASTAIFPFSLHGNVAFHF